MFKNILVFLDNMRKTNYADATIKNYEIHLRSYYSFCIQKEVDYLNIKNYEILEYRNIISSMYRPSTVNTKLSAIRKFYDFLIDYEYTNKNIIRDSLFIKNLSRKPDPLSEKNQKLLFSWLSDKKENVIMCYRVLFNTGLRVSEIANLKKSDIRIINNRLVLDINNTKNKSNRLVPLFSELLVDDFLDFYERTFEERLFNMSIRAIQHYAKNFSDEYGIKFNVHMTRHTFATNKVKQGMKLNVLQKILGHKDIRTTMYYVLTEDVEIIELGAEVERND